MTGQLTGQLTETQRLQVRDSCTVDASYRHTHPIGPTVTTRRFRSAVGLTWEVPCCEESSWPEVATMLFL